MARSLLRVYTLQLNAQLSTRLPPAPYSVNLVTEYVADPLYKVYAVTPQRVLPLLVRTRFQVLFHPSPFFSPFPHGTGFTIGQSGDGPEDGLYYYSHCDAYVSRPHHRASQHMRFCVRGCHLYRARLSRRFHYNT